MIGEFFIIRGKILRLFRDLFKNSDVIIDIGCGESPYYHKSIKAKIVCADINTAKKPHVASDAMHLPFKSSKFDGIVCVNSLYYCKNPFKSIKEFSRILKKKGKLAMITPFIYPIHDIPDDKYRFTEYGIKELLNGDFIISEIRTIGGIFNIPAAFLHSAIKGLPLLAPKNIRVAVKFLSIAVLYHAYIAAQLISLLDFLDKSKRWPTYYFTIAIKK